MYAADLPADAKVLILTGKNGSGKTRWLERFATQYLGSPVTKGGRLICMSGTIHDRFPMFTEVNHRYAYLGRRTVTNIVSEIAPYRALLRHLVPQTDSSFERRTRIASDKLSAIGVDSTIDFDFRRVRKSRKESEALAAGGGTQIKVSDPSQLGLTAAVELDLLKPEVAKDELVQRISSVETSAIHLSKVGFRKSGTHIDLMDLSSGERSYVFAVLALSFCFEAGSTVLFDEPENSLHPSWQVSIMRDMWEIMNAVAEGGRLVVATHSPLIASSSSNAGTFVRDMERHDEWQPSNLHGGSSDTTLKQQFGLLSPRSVSFLDLVRKCLIGLVTVESDPRDFRDAATRLRDLKVNLDLDDPLYRTVQDILDRLETLQ